jgi:hypothetical protein
VIRGWDAYERGRGAVPVIDFDFRPDITDTIEITSRLDAYNRIRALLDRARAAGDDERVIGRAEADVAYLANLLGERWPLREYIKATQGVDPVGWSEEYIGERGEIAKKALADLGIGWGPNTMKELHELEGPIDMDQAIEEMRKAADEYEAPVRDLTGSTASFNVTFEVVDVDAYWSYWLDGAGPDVRVRLNRTRAQHKFTSSRSLQFALHEILGHGLQSASIAAVARTDEVSWVRLLSVHARQQALLEGIAQAMPVLLGLADPVLNALVATEHFGQLVRSQMHLLINSDRGLRDACKAAERVPFLDDVALSDLLSDRGANPQLRSYLWAYPVGFDYFVSAAERTPSRVQRMLAAAYREPLALSDLDLFNE